MQEVQDTGGDRVSAQPWSSRIWTLCAVLGSEFHKGRGEVTRSRAGSKVVEGLQSKLKELGRSGLRKRHLGGDVTAALNCAKGCREEDAAPWLGVAAKPV